MVIPEIVRQMSADQAGDYAKDLSYHQRCEVLREANRPFLENLDSKVDVLAALAGGAHDKQIILAAHKLDIPWPGEPALYSALLKEALE